MTRQFGCIRSMLLSCLMLMAVASSSEGITWTANWIWQQDDGPQDTWMCFRKQFTLANTPAKAVASIAVDSRYYLWINGTKVCSECGLNRGPALASSTYYDTLDIAKYLKQGKNTISILVVYFGKSGFFNVVSGKGGLMFQASIDNTPIVSDRTWKLKPHPAYSPGASPNDRYSQHDEMFDAQKDIPDWITEGFDDSQWIAATEKGVPPALPWGPLTKNYIPLFRDYGLKPYVNTMTFPITGTGADITGKLPYNCHVTQYMKVNSTSGGQTITMKTDHYEVNEQTILCKYTCKPGVQEFENHQWTNGENVLYTVPSGVQVLDLKYRETGYDADLLRSFSCDSVWYETLWKKCQRTLYVCMRDNYMDCPDRERAGWTGNTCNDLGQALFSLDRRADFLALKSVRDQINFIPASGELPSVVPGNYTTELPGQGLLVCSEYGFPWEYYMETGDSSELRRSYQPFKTYLAKWTFGSNGLVVHRSGGWDWWDWSSVDEPVIENALYYSAIKTLKKIAVIIGQPADTVGYNATMSQIKNSYNQQLWTTNGYASAGDPLDNSNAWAFLSGIADPSKWAGVRQVLANKSECSVYMDKYVSEALFQMGYTDDAFKRMRNRYDYDVTKDCSTLWTSNDGASHNHSWAGGPLIMMGSYIAGIRPEKPGFETFHVLPQMGKLSSVNQTLQSVRGNIIVNLAKKSDGFSMQVSIPTTTTGILGIPKTFDNGTAVLSVKVNNTVIWPSGTLAGIAFDATDSRYIRFKAQPGTWILVAGNGPPVNERHSNPAKSSTAVSLTFRVSTGSICLPVPRQVLENREKLRLTIFSIAGEAVRSLDVYPDGTGRLAVNGCEDLLPGMYLVRLMSVGIDEAVPLVVR